MLFMLKRLINITEGYTPSTLLNLKKIFKRKILPIAQMLRKKISLKKIQWESSFLNLGKNSSYYKADINMNDKLASLAADVEKN